MKKIVLLITTICLTSETFGQKTSSSSVDEYECIYEYQMKNDKGSSDATSTILQIGRNSAMFSDYTAFQADSCHCLQSARIRDSKVQDTGKEK